MPCGSPGNRNRKTARPGTGSRGWPTTGFANRGYFILAVNALRRTCFGPVDNKQGRHALYCGCPADLDPHLIVDNYATHMTPSVKRWLKVRPRFHMHFISTSAFRLSMVECFSPRLPETAYAAASSRASPDSRLPSWNTLKSTIPIQSPSPGPSPPAKSSKKSLGRNTC
jgi:hypothetical protein